MLGFHFFAPLLFTIYPEEKIIDRSGGRFSPQHGFQLKGLSQSISRTEQDCLGIYIHIHDSSQFYEFLDQYLLLLIV